MCVTSSRPSSCSLTWKSPALLCSPQLFMHRIKKQAVKSALNVLLPALQEQTVEEKFCSESTAQLLCITLRRKEIYNFILLDIKIC